MTEMVAEPAIWILLLPVVVLGGFAAIVALVVFAIAKNRPGIVAAIGGTLLLLFCGGLVSLFAVRQSAHVTSTQWQITPTNIEANFDGGTQSSQTHMRISWIGLLFVIALPFVLLFAFFRNLTSNKTGGERCGGRGFAPTFFALLLVAGVGLFGAKWFSARQYTRSAARQAIARDSAELQAAVQRQATAIQRQASAMNDKIQRQVAEMNIHELMDKVDAPRIPLPPTPSPPQPPAASVVAILKAESGGAVATIETSAAKSEEVDADLAAEAKAAVAAIAEDDKSASDKSQDATPAADKSATDKPAADKPATTPAESPAAEAASPSEADREVEKVPVTAPRPSWVNDPPKRVGEVWREVLVTDEYASVDECTRATDVYLLLKTYERIQELAGRPVFDTSLPSISFNGRTVMGDGRVILSSDGGRTWNWSDPRISYLNSLGIGVDYVRREIVAKDPSNGGESRQHFETVERSFGPMYRLYTQIEFTPSVDNELRRRWEVSQRDERLAMVGTGAGGILGLLGLVYGLLKVDTWTKGYYTKRLFLGVPAAIIGLAALFAMMVS